LSYLAYFGVLMLSGFFFGLYSYARPIFSPMAIETAEGWQNQAVAWSRNCEGRRPTSLETPGRHAHTYYTAVFISGFAKGKVTQCRFRTHSQPASLLPNH